MAFVEATRMDIYLNDQIEIHFKCFDRRCRTKHFKVRGSGVDDDGIPYKGIDSILNQVRHGRRIRSGMLLCSPERDCKTRAGEDIDGFPDGEIAIHITDNTRVILKQT